jgi:formylglycine-generating enzyme required for sulfatase activity
MLQRFFLHSIVGVAALVLLASPAPAELVPLTFVTVGDPGNTGETTGDDGDLGPIRTSGAVGYEFRMGKYEVTAGQYCEFLNAVAWDTDPGHLWQSKMWEKTQEIGGTVYDFASKIERTGTSGAYVYTVAADRENRALGGVSWTSAARFANWLHNGKPTGVQDATTTEDGAYDMSLSAGNYKNVVRKPGAKFFLPSEDEWYKAAYYKGGSTNAYWDYSNQSDTVPTHEGPPGTDAVNGSANYRADSGDWPGAAAVGSPYWRNEAGAYTHKPSSSYYGAYDMCGNVYEWTEELMGEDDRGIRGGAYSYKSANMHAGNLSYGYFPEKVDPDPQFGFRVAAEIPEPASITLLVCGSLAGLLRRRRK